VLAHFGHHLLTAIPVPLLPMIRSEFGLDYTQSGLVISAFSLAYGIGQLPAGWLADRIGRRVMITIGILGVAACGLVVGLSHTYIMMIVFLALMGLMGGGYHPSASPAISASVEPQNRGAALGFHIIGGSASYFLAPLAAAAIAAFAGWRGPFIALAIPAIIFGSIFYIALRRLPVLDRTGNKTSSIDSQTSEKPERVRHLVIFIVLSALTASVIHSVTSFIPLFLVDHFGVAKEIGGAFLALVYAAGLWASILGGYLSDHFGRVRIMILACFALGFLTYFLNLAPFGLGIGALLLIIGMFNYIRMPATESYVIHNTSEKYRSTILGIYYFSSMEGSGVLTPVIGNLIDNLGFYYAFTISSAAVLVITLVCSLLLRTSHD
jgi:MFS family permease